jgi:hypothetical protein
MSHKEFAESMTKLTKSEENSLADHIQVQTKAGYPISMLVTQSLADQMLLQRAAKEGTTPLRPVAKIWHQGFFGRLPNIGTEKTKVIERMGVEGATCLCLEHNSDLFQEMVCRLLAENVYSMDKTGGQLGVDKEETCVIDKTISNRIQKALQDRESAPVIECISAASTHLTPFVILGAKTHHSQWYPEHGGGPAKWHCATSPNGYTDNELAMEWLEKVFHPETVERAAGKWRLLVLDGHGSHETADFLTSHYGVKSVSKNLSSRPLLHNHIKKNNFTNVSTDTNRSNYSSKFISRLLNQL